jgi:type IV pilus assembly protein PilY1
LPAVANRQSCDGQGIYFLSDGEPNNTPIQAQPESAVVLDKPPEQVKFAPKVLPRAVDITVAELSNTTADSGWACMGEFAKRLFDKTKNPAGVSIQTAKPPEQVKFAPKVLPRAVDITVAERVFVVLFGSPSDKK